MTGPVLYLVHNGDSIPLHERGIAIGRLPECDLVLEGWEVSRRHARIHPTTAGPVLVDRSRFGTFVNNMQVVGPLLLADGDVLRLGANMLTVSRTPAPGLAVRRTPALRSRIGTWWARYGVSEAGGILAAVVGALAARHFGGGVPATAVAALLTETAWFYFSLAVRDLRYEARKHHAARRPFDRWAAADVLRNLVREYGAAEGVDLLLRPLCYGIGISLLGTVAGVLAGKLLADLLFYGPVLATWHWRLARRAPPPSDAERHRATMAVELPPMRQLVQRHVEADLQTPEAPPAPPRISTEG
jgi:hypothetical protein